MDLTGATIVVLSEGNNPRILNPDFLERNGIAPSSWEVADVLVLPPVSRVVYKNSVEVQMEETRVVFAARTPSQVDWETELPRMALGLLSTLPHVNYRSVGLNFDVATSTRFAADTPETLTELLLKSGDWLKNGDIAYAMELKLLYRLSDSALNITINFGSDDEPDQPEGLIRFHGNFHCGFDPSQTDQRNTYISSMPHRLPKLVELLRRFPVVQEAT